MSQIYADRKKTGAPAPHTKTLSGRGPSLEALRSGAAAPTAEQLGRRVDLPDAMREKMESAFGADLSSVKLYESEAVKEAGANAVTRGSDIAFAPGMLDFSSFGGQSLLGHELSHVVSQARGEVAGGGFLNDRALEARADREGAMAAAGQQISSPAASLSPVSATAAAGPMQAKKPWQKEEAPLRSQPAYEGTSIDPTRAGEINENRNVSEFFMENATHRASRPGGEALKDRLFARYQGPGYKPNSFVNREVGSSLGRNITGLGQNRVAAAMEGSLGLGRSDQEIQDTFDNLMAANQTGVNLNDPQEKENANQRLSTGLSQLKQMEYDSLLRLESTYGTLGSQMHPEDFIKQLGPDFFEHTRSLQDASQMLKDAGDQFDFKNNADDRHFRDLTDYYNPMFGILNMYATAKMTGDSDYFKEMVKTDSRNQIPKGLEKKVAGPSMDRKQQAAYKKGLKQRAASGGWGDFLFGRFK